MPIRTLALALLLSGPALAQSRTPLAPVSDQMLKQQIKPGEEIAGRADGDLNGDGDPDTAYVVAGEDSRTLVVLLRTRGAGPGYRRVGTFRMEPYAQGAADLSIAKDVLKIDDLTGGATAISATYRFRLDPARQRMRLIGLDATLYSRTLVHDGYEVSWNLLTGGAMTRDLILARDGGDAAYDMRHERHFKRQHAPLYMEQNPDAEEMMTALRSRN